MTKTLQLVRLCTLALLTARAPGQATWRVNGPDLQTAIDAAAPGDILLVQGSYSGFGLRIHKPLFIHGVPGAEIAIFFGNIEITGIPAGSAVVLQGFGLRLATIGPPVNLHDCDGVVLLAGLQGNAGSEPSQAVRCSQVAIDECDFGPMLIDRATALVTRSRFAGTNSNARLNSPATWGLHAQDAVVIATGTRFNGGHGDQLLSARSGLSSLRSEMRLSGSSNIVAAGSDLIGPVDAVAGTGSLAYDRRTTFLPSAGGTSIDPRLVPALSRLPVTSITRTAVGEMTTMSLDGEPGEAFALFGFVPTQRLRLVGFGGELWALPGLVVTQGRLDGNGHFQFSFPVPSDEPLRGVVFRWQGASTSGTEILLGEPITECHR